MSKNRMYAYLARRDKKGVKFIGSFAYSSKVYPTRISEDDIKSLNMDQKTSLEISEALRQNRMEYELFLETADSLESLRSSLIRRGYSKIPASHFSSSMKSGRIDERMLVTQKSIMTRRGSSIR